MMRTYNHKNLVEQALYTAFPPHTNPKEGFFFPLRFQVARVILEQKQH